MTESWTGPVAGIAVFAIDADRPPATAADVLAADENARADRLVRAVDQTRFRVVRGALRRILGRWLERDPAALRFVYGAQGKPVLADHPLAFNVSHSHERALIAVGAVPAIGIDLQRHDPRTRYDAIARRFFAADDAAGLAALPAALRPAAFFATWARTEAVVKALGGGLAENLSRFTVGVGDPPRLVPPVAAEWPPLHLADLAVGDGWSAALAYAGPAQVIHHLQWP